MHIERSAARLEWDCAAEHIRAAPIVVTAARLQRQKPKVLCLGCAYRAASYSLN